MKQEPVRRLIFGATIFPFLPFFQRSILPSSLRHVETKGSRRVL